MEIFSLGHNCSIAAMLRKAGLLKQINPFDNFATSNLRLFVNLFLSQGSGFFATENIEWIGSHKTRYKIRDNKNGIISIHGLPLYLDRDDALDLLVSTTQPRMERFFKVLREDDKVLLLRSNRKNTTLEETVYLYDTISEIRGGKEFSLCVFQDRPFADKEWGLKGLEFYRATSPTYESNHWVYPEDWIVSVKCMCWKHGLGDPTDHFMKVIKVL